jgi:hypothetical protein
LKRAAGEKSLVRLADDVCDVIHHGRNKRTQLANLYKRARETASCLTQLFDNPLPPPQLGAYKPLPPQTNASKTKSTLTNIMSANNQQPSTAKSYLDSATATFQHAVGSLTGPLPTSPHLST